jgi:uncharacterized protein (TIGR03435 family)
MQQPGSTLAAFIAAASIAAAQAPSFDVASVKVNHSGARTTRIASPRGTGRFDVTNAMVHTLILNAYGLQSFQLTGGPAWIDDTRFDIAARTNPGTSREDISAMLRSLLVERFHLATHREPREMPTYALTLARKDGQVGPQLNASTTPCPAAAPAAPGPPPTSPSGQTLCGTTMTPSELNAGNMTMARLATTLSGIVGRMVTDETGLTGVYDLRLTFTPENPGSPLAGPPVAADDNAASIFAALTEQLGLKLEPRRALVDVVVIDRVEMPTED